MNKLPDINYALIAQLSYLNWNKLEDKKEVEGKFIEDILFKDIIISQIKTDFYNNPKNFPNTDRHACRDRRPCGFPSPWRSGNRPHNTGKG